MCHGGTVGACRGATEPGERVRTFEVAPAKVACVSWFPTECLRVRTPPDTGWRLFYDPIEGFAYEAGYRYVIQVAERPVPNPPADGSSLAYRLVRVVSRTAAEGCPGGATCVAGVVRRYVVEGGVWAVRGGDGVRYDPIGGLPAECRVDGLRVHLAAGVRGDVGGAHVVGPVVEVLAVLKF